MPAVVVLNTPERIAFFWREGTRWKDVSRHPIGGEVLTFATGELTDQTWTETDVLMLARPEEAHSVYVMWEAGHTKLRCWYVNLQTPLRRTRIGFDMMDQELDIVIDPDLSAWRWKDVDEFDRMVAEGVFSASEAHAIRTEGERVIREMKAVEPPFCEGWEKWSPPPEWQIPELPPGWDIFLEA
jgi:hypothetical protein